MTTQHAPHSPPMWRKFLSLPHTRLGWWAIGLSGTFWVLQATQDWVFTAIAMESLSGVEQWLVIWALVLPGVAGTVVASIALLRGLERSALVWLAMVAGLPAFLGAGWNVLVFVGMNWLGEIPTLLVMAALVVLINVASIALLRGLDRSALVWLVTAFLSAGWLVLVFVGINWPGEIPTLLVMAALVVLINVLIAWLGLHRSGRPR